MAALLTRRAFVASLFAAPAVIAAPRLMRVSSTAFDFWVRFQDWPLEQERPPLDGWQAGVMPYRNFRELVRLEPPRPWAWRAMERPLFGGHLTVGRAAEIAAIPRNGPARLGSARPLLIRALSPSPLRPTADYLGVEAEALSSAETAGRFVNPGRPFKPIDMSRQTTYAEWDRKMFPQIEARDEDT